LETEASSEITTLVLLGTLGGIILASSLVVFVTLYNKKLLAEKHQLTEAKLNYQKQLLTASLEIEERERKEIAKNVHDDIGALLSLILINETRMVKGFDEASEKYKLYQNNKENVGLISDSLRNITNQLYSPVLSKFGLAEGLRDIFVKFNASPDVRIELNAPTEHISLDPNVQMQLYRSILEIINNSLKHGRAKEIEVKMVQKNRKLNCTVTHDGDGLSQKQFDQLIKAPTGLGLSNLQGRVESMGGNLVYGSNSDSGRSQVQITIEV
jgi:two-component system NarL family sensor kinase